jgi:hypothetical protein
VVIESVAHHERSLHLQVVLIGSGHLEQRELASEIQICYEVKIEYAKTSRNRNIDCDVTPLFVLFLVPSSRFLTSPILYIAQYILVSSIRTRNTLFELSPHCIHPLYSTASIILLGVLLTLAVEPDEATIQVRRKGKPDTIRGQEPRRFALGRAV